MTRKGILLALLIVLVAAAVAAAVALSNISEFGGPVSGGVITTSPISSGGMPGEYGGVLSFQNNTTKQFDFIMTNNVDRTVAFNVSVHFWMSGIVAGGFTVLGFAWYLDGVVLDPTPSVNTTTSWFEDYPSSLGPFASRQYALTVTFIFIGAGDYTLQVWAS